MTDNVHWIVPARRLVVLRNVSYYDLITAWIESLESHREPLSRWYGAGAHAYDVALDGVTAWRDRTWRTEVPVVREGRSTLEAVPVMFWGRLWKGPLRVLLEERTRPGVALGTEIYDPLEIAVDHQASVALRLSSLREVENSDAIFLMGDVVELPLFKFLGVCGLGSFGAEPLFDNQLEFNPNGSFLLGTSIREKASGTSPPSSAHLHDNLVAMRFQMLLNAYRGAFASYENGYDADRGPGATSGGETIHARGLMYAGTLGPPRRRPRPHAPADHWGIETRNWGAKIGGGIPYNMPTRSGLTGLERAAIPADQNTLTPGSTCSPTTLFLLNYMIRNLTGGGSGSDSVGHTWRDPAESAVFETVYEEVTPTTLAALVPVRTPADLRAIITRLVPRVRALVPRASGDTVFTAEVVDDFDASPGWDAVPSRPFTESRTNPESLMRALVRGIAAARRRREEDELHTLRQLRDRLIEEAQRFSQELDSLLDSDDYRAIPAARPYHDFARHIYAVYRQNLRALPGSPQVQIRAFSGIRQIGRALRERAEALDATLALIDTHPERVISRWRQQTLDLTSQLGDVNVVSMNGHEWAVVRVHSHDKTMESQPLPRGGFVAAYDPLSGEPCHGPGCHAQGQCYVFESGGQLKRWQDGRQKRNLFGAGPSKWSSIDRNMFTIQVDDTTHRVFLGQGNSARDKQLMGLYRLPPAGGADTLASKHLESPLAFEPLLMYPNAVVAPPRSDAHARFVTHGRKIYAARAVPFPTMKEAVDAYPLIATITAHFAALCTYAVAQHAPADFLAAIGVTPPAAAPAAAVPAAAGVATH